MKKVVELIALPKAKGQFGIEIEAEGEGIKEVQYGRDGAKYWVTTNDGSLRGRYPDQKAEFVLRTPVTYGAVIPALEELIDAQKEAKFDFSFRTSVHVHYNVQQYTSNQVLNFIYTYLLVEELLIKYCGEERVGNRFCLRLQDAEGILQTLNELFTKGVTAINGVQEDNIRYSSLNIAAIRKYGSVEFRGMRGTLDKKVLMVWIDAIQSIGNYALSMKTPTDIYEEYSDMSYEDFIKKVLGDGYKNFLYQGFENDVARSFSLSLELPFLYNLYNKDRNGFVEEKVEAPKVKWADIGKHPMEEWALPQPAAPAFLQQAFERLNAAQPAPARPAPAPRRRAAAIPIIVDDIA